MKIGGFQKSSLLDYPGKIAAIIFTQGCNFRCGYCHNPELLANTSASSFDEVSVLKFLQSRQGLLDGIVVSGGEPCLQNDIVDFIQKIKSLGFYVKLDTNGAFPDVLEELLKRKLVDYIAMDIKAALEKYDTVISSKIDTKKIQKSIEMIKNSGVEYEFRTTVIKSQMSDDDFEQISKIICDAKRYYLQKFVASKNLNTNLENENYTEDELEKIAKNLRKNIKEVSIR